MKYCFGADVGGTTIKLGLFTVDGDVYKRQVKTWCRVHRGGN